MAVRMTEIEESVPIVLVSREIVTTIHLTQSQVIEALCDYASKAMKMPVGPTMVSFQLAQSLDKLSFGEGDANVCEIRIASSEMDGDE